MPPKPVIMEGDINAIELLINPHTNIEAVYQHHIYACSKCPNVLRKRPLEDFQSNPDHALLRVWFKGAKKPISAGLAVLFDVNINTVELGSLYVSPVFRGKGFGQILADTLAAKLNDDNHLGKHPDVKLTAKVRYGNEGPIEILNRTGFEVKAITGGKSHWVYNPEAAEKTAERLVGAITKHSLEVEDDLFHSLAAVYNSTQKR